MPHTVKSHVGICAPGCNVRQDFRCRANFAGTCVQRGHEDRIPARLPHALKRLERHALCFFCFSRTPPLLCKGSTLYCVERNAPDLRKPPIIAVSIEGPSVVVKCLRVYPAQPIFGPGPREFCCPLWEAKEPVVEW